MKLKSIINNKRFLLITLGVLALGSAAAYFYYGRGAKAEDYLTGKVEKGTIRNTVSATGLLQAVTTVQVGSQVSGNIAALDADFNSVVRKGQVIARLDPSVLQAQVSQQRANLEQAKANLANVQAKLLAAESEINTQRAGVSGATANLAALKAQRDDAAKFLERQQALATSGLIPERDLESAKANFNTADARYNQATSQLEQARVSEQTAANAGLAQAKAAVEQAKAQVQQTQAALRMAEVNLSYTTITSPINGVVVSRNVDVGQTVAASLSAPTLFTIANDLTQMQVIASIDQADIGVINQENRVSFTVDAYPGQAFQGTINQIRLNAQNVQNVVTYNVVIDVKNPDLKLKPGMTANLTFAIAERVDVLKIPNAALRFRPQDITPEKMREMLGNDPSRGRRRPDAQESPSGSPAGEQPQMRRRERDGQSGNQARNQTGSQAGSQAGNQPGGQAGNAPGQGRRRQRDQQGGPTDNRADEGATRPGGERIGGFAPSSAVLAEGQWRVVWSLGPDNKPHPRRIQIGITDGSSTEVLKGDLKEGDLLIVGQNISSNSANQGRPQTPPGFGGGPGRGGFGGGGRR